MDQKLREKIALIAFIIVVIGGFAGGIWYNLYAGHQWNVAATKIDDAAGKMTGYTTFVFDGVAVPQDQSTSIQNPISLAAVKSLYQSKGSSVISLDLVHPEKYLDSEIVWVGNKRVGVFYANQPLSHQQITERVSTLHEQSVDYIVCIADSGAYVDTNAISSSQKQQSQPSSLSSDKASKKNTSTPNTSSSTQSSSSQRTQSQSLSDAEATGDTSSQNQSDSSSDAATSSQQNSSSGETGIDIVITLDSESALSQGKAIDHTYFVSAPTIGSYGLVVISPYNVVSSDVISKL